MVVSCRGAAIADFFTAEMKAQRLALRDKIDGRRCFRRQSLHPEARMSADWTASTICRKVFGTLGQGMSCDHEVAWRVLGQNDRLERVWNFR